MNPFKAREKQMKILNILFAIVVYMISFAYPSFANQPEFFIKSVDTNSEIVIIKKKINLVRFFLLIINKYSFFLIIKKIIEIENKTKNI